MPDYREIASEVLSCIQTGTGNKFFITDTDQIKAQCPKLCSYLRDIDLFDRWDTTGISKLDPHSDLMLHSDGRCRWALNLPILNCDQSYTIWYDAERKGNVSNVIVEGQETAATYVRYRADTAREIDRVCSDVPVWVNVHTPHAAINLSKHTRMLLSLRFTPELDDLFVLPN